MTIEAPKPEAPKLTEADIAALAGSFYVTYAEAVAAADPATGTIPAMSIDACRVSFRAIPAIPRTHRTEALSAAAANEQALALADPAKPNVGALLAIGNMATALATLPAGNAPKPKPEADPVDSAAFAFTVLYASRARIAATLGLTPEQVTTAHNNAVAATDRGNADPFGFIATFGAAIDRVSNGKRARTASTESTGERLPAGSIDAHIVEALGTVDPGTALSTRQIANMVTANYGTDGKPLASDGAIRNALNDPKRLAAMGVTATMVPGERGKPVPGALIEAEAV